MQNTLFKPGDKVLVVLPIPGCSLQAHYGWPYLIKEKVGDRDYLVVTPDRQRRMRLCHVNMLKSYCDRDQSERTTERMETDEAAGNSRSLHNTKLVADRIPRVLSTT